MTRSATTATTDATVPVASLKAPRHENLLASATYAFFTLLLGAPALTGKFLVGPNSDQYIAGYPFREFAASTLKATGHFPLWNPYLFGGMPYVAAMHGDIFYPTFLLRLFLPTDVAMTWGFIIHVFLAGLFTFLFLRATGFGFYGSLFGGIAYMMSGQIASLVSPGHDGKLFVSALFPLTLLLLVRGVRDGKRWSWGVLALVIGLAVISPHPQLLEYLLIASLAYSVFLLLTLRKSKAVPNREVVKRAILGPAAVILGMLVGAIQYLPVREYIAWSPRAGGLADYERATSYAWPPAELFNSYLPQFTGMLEHYWGESGIHFHSDYIGVTVLILAGAAFVGLRSDPRRREIWFWTGVLIVATLWALGGHTPFYHIPYAIVPGTKFFRAPNTVFFVGTMAIAFLCAAGVEHVLDLKVGKKYLYGWLGFSALIALLATTGILNNIAQGLALEQQVDRAIGNSVELLKGSWRSFAFTIATVALLLFIQRRQIPIRIAGWALAALAAVDLWTILRVYWTFSAPASQLYASDPTIDYLKGQPQPARVITLQLGYPSRDPGLTGDGLMVHDVRNVLGYHGNQLKRYDKLLDRDRGYPQLANPNVWHLLNARYLLADVDDVSRFFPNAKKVAGPAKDAAGLNVSLFELPGESPYAWVVPIIVKAGDDAVLGTVIDPRFDVRRAGLFDSAAAVTGAQNVTALPEPLAIAATVSRYEPGRVSVKLAAPAPQGSALIVSENYFPGWSARVDGREGTAARADYTLIGVPLPTGAQNVELSFDDPAYQKGKIVTLVALVLIVLAIGAGVVTERRAVA
ncbi:MAG TPA: hypothetical protein VM099_02295 [Gemmatimonadaceae bacterium]|nr:hypothetical protein [Gemmatimonadaceae bacterium]